MYHCEAIKCKWKLDTESVSLITQTIMVKSDQQQSQYVSNSKEPVNI